MAATYLCFYRCGFGVYFRAKLSYHCKVPGKHTPPAYLTDAVVTEMQNGWNLKKLKTGNEETLKGGTLTSLQMTAAMNCRNSCLLLSRC